MANALGTLATGLVIQRSLDLVFNMYPLLNSITLDLSDEAVAYNQSIITRKQVLGTVNNFGTGATDRADVAATVTLNNHKEVHHKFLVDEYSGTSRNLVDESAAPLAEAIAKHMIAAVAALWTNTNYGGGSAQETITTTANMNYSAATQFRADLNGRGVPARGRFLVVNSAGYKSMLNDSLAVAWQNNQAATSVIVDGMLTNVAGFSVFEYPDLLTTGTSTGVKTAVAGSPDSTILACRVQRNPAELLPNSPFPGNYGIVTNAQTGLSVLVTEWIDASNMAANVRVSWMYGVATGNTNNAQIIKSA